MNHMSFNDANLEQSVTVDMTLRQAIHIANLIAFHLESGLSVDEEDMLILYEDIFNAISPFGIVD